VGTLLLLPTLVFVSSSASSLIHIVEIFGKRFQNSPSLLKIGDQLLWKYANDIMPPVTVEGVKLPTIMQSQTIYSVRIKPRNQTEDDVRHEHLFVPINRDGIFDQHDLLRVNTIENSSVSGQLKLCANSDNAQ